MTIEHYSRDFVGDLPLSEVVMAGDFAFVSGMLAFDDSGNIVQGGIRNETKCIINDLEALLNDLDLSMDNIVKVNVYLTDSDYFDGFNEVYAEFMPKKRPARAAVVSALTLKASIEMDFVVYTGRKSKSE